MAAKPQALTKRSKGGRRWPWKWLQGEDLGARQADRLIPCTGVAWCRRPDEESKRVWLG